MLLSLRFLVLSQTERMETEDDEGERGYTGCMDEGIICIRTNNVHLYKQAQYEDIHNQIQSFKGYVHITMESIEKNQ